MLRRRKQTVEVVLSANASIKEAQVRVLEFIEAMPISMTVDQYWDLVYSLYENRMMQVADGVGAYDAPGLLDELDKQEITNFLEYPSESIRDYLGDELKGVRYDCLKSMILCFCKLTLGEMFLNFEQISDFLNKAIYSLPHAANTTDLQIPKDAIAFIKDRRLAVTGNLRLDIHFTIKYVF